MNLHRLLTRQINRYLGRVDEIDPKWQTLLNAISAFYVETDRERELMQNAMAVNSAELTELNEQLRVRNRELMQTMLNTLSEGVYATDTDGCITFMNLSAEKILNRTEREMIGHKAHDVIHHQRPDNSVHPVEECPLIEANTLGLSVAGEEYFIHSDGHFIPVSYRSNPLKHEGQLLGALVSFRDISERLKSEEQIYQLAFFDPLTGLPNRRLLMDRLGQVIAVSARQQQYSALLFIDIDHFKVVNDTLGHESGDVMLNEVAKRLKSLLRAEDTVARFGGDEFVVILEELDGEISRAATQAHTTANKIVHSLGRPYFLKDKECNSTASVGIVLFLGQDEGLDEILKRSDLAMYDAKKAGRNRVRFFDPTMQHELEVRTRLESDLRHALAEDQFELYYQKRVDTHGRTRGAEALLRWVSPVRGMVEPAEFIPVAEETGLIMPIGQWVLRQACHQLKAWENSAEAKDIVLSINVSAREFEQDDFVEKVRRALTYTGANASKLELEVTESMLTGNIEDLIEKMHALREIGISFALDDFGTGYSSLSYLKKLPLHKLKIDQSFVRDLEIDKNDEAIVQTVIQIGKTLGLEVIAEGVEKPSQCSVLKQHGCHNFQGYLFGKPVPVDIFEKELDDSSAAYAVPETEPLL